MLLMLCFQSVTGIYLSLQVTAHPSAIGIMAQRLEEDTASVEYALRYALGSASATVKAVKSLASTASMADSSRKRQVWDGWPCFRRLLMMRTCISCERLQLHNGPEHVKVVQVEAPIRARAVHWNDPEVPHRGTRQREVIALDLAGPEAGLLLMDLQHTLSGVDAVSLPFHNFSQLAQQPLFCACTQKSSEYCALTNKITKMYAL